MLMKNLSAYLDEFIQEENGNYFNEYKGKCSFKEKKSKERKKFKGDDIDKFLAARKKKKEYK